MVNAHLFSEKEKRGVYRAIHERRDVRAQFLPEPIPPEILGRILDAAHHAPSVGFMQPWDFIVIENPNVRRAIQENFERANGGALVEDAQGQGQNTSAPSIQLDYNIDLGSDEICKFACDAQQTIFEPVLPQAQGFSPLAGSAVKDIDQTRLRLAGTNADAGGAFTVETGQPAIDPRTKMAISASQPSIFCAKQEHWEVVEMGNVAEHFDVVTIYEQPVTLSMYAILLLKPGLTKGQTDAIVNGFAKYTPGSVDPMTAAMQGMRKNKITSDMFCVRPHFTLEKKGSLIPHRRGPAPGESLESFVSNADPAKNSANKNNPPRIVLDLPQKANFAGYVEKRNINVKKLKKEEELCPPPPPSHDPVHEREVNEADLVDDHPRQVREIAQDDADGLGCEVGATYELKIAELLRWPEFMVEWKDIEVHIGCMQVVLRWPFLRTRSCEMSLFAYAGFDPRKIPQHVIDRIKTCVYTAAASAAVVGVVTFNFAAALQAFTGIFSTCIEISKDELLACLVPGLALLTFHSPWQ